MSTVPKHIAKILRVNAHPRFILSWVDHFDEIYATINRWIDKVQLQDDREELQKVAAWMVPYLCAEPGERQAISPPDVKHFEHAWQHILDDMDRMYQNDPSHKLLGRGHSDLEHKITAAKRRHESYVPKRGERRKILDQGIGRLFWRLETIGKDPTTQEYAVLELFKMFNFDGFPEMPTDKAYNIINRMRRAALKHPREKFEPPFN